MLESLLAVRDEFICGLERVLNRVEVAKSLMLRPFMFKIFGLRWVYSWIKNT